MAATNLPVDDRRLWTDLMALAAITEPGEPYTRRSFTPRFLEGRAWLVQRFRDAGLTVRIAAGAAVLFEAVRRLDQNPRTA